MKKYKNAQAGRSMVEILGVLAIIGILSVCGILGYRYAMKKYTANLLIQEAHIAYANAQGVNEEETNWTPVDFTPKCGYNMFTGKDEDGDTFVLVENIDNEMCQLIMQLGNNEQLSFYQEIEHEETTIGAVTSCTPEPMDIIFAFNGTRAPGKDCETNEECVESEGGYCNADTGTCYECPVGKEPNESRTFCNPICDAENESECWSGERRWCCGGNTICGQNVDECPESDGFCKYSFENAEMKGKAGCSYRISDETMTLSTNCSYEVSDETMGMHTNCSFTVSSDTMTLTTNCSYTNGLASDGETLNMTIGTACPSGQYCYLSFKTSDCSSSVSATGAETIYGVCTDMNNKNASCAVQKASEGDMVTQSNGCPSGQYCYLSFKNDSCTSSAGANHTGTIYGVCSDMNNKNPSCSTDMPSSGEMVKESKGCPNGQYCYLSFKNNTCTSAADAKHTGTLHGVCAFMDNKNPSCSLNLPDAQEMVQSISDCPKGQYCYLSFTTETCTGAAGANYTGIIYGACADMNNKNPSCEMEMPDLEKMLSVQTDCPRKQYCYMNFKSKGCTDTVDAKGSNPLWGVCLDMYFNLNDLGECPVVE